MTRNRVLSFNGGDPGLPVVGLNLGFRYIPTNTAKKHGRKPITAETLARRLPKAPLPSEHQEQAAVVQWMCLQFPGLSVFAIPNGGHRHKATAARLKAEGVRPGLPDLMIPVPWNGKHGLFVEMKRQKGGQVSAAQHEVIATLRAWGYAVEVCPGFEAAKAAIEEYFKGYRPTIGGHHEKA